MNLNLALLSSHKQQGTNQTKEENAIFKWRLLTCLFYTWKCIVVFLISCKCVFKIVPPQRCVSVWLSLNCRLGHDETCDCDILSRSQWLQGHFCCQTNWSKCQLRNSNCCLKVRLISTCSGMFYGIFRGFWTTPMHLFHVICMGLK